MATVRAIVTGAYREIGIVTPGFGLTAELAQVGLETFQRQLDAWQADRLTLSVQGATAITWPSSTSTQTIGVGGDITAQRPMFINTMNYVIPGSSPAVEVAMGPMDPDQYAALTIKGLQAGLPQLFFYQTSTDTVLGTLFIWPQPTQSLTLNLYAPQAIGIPVDLNSTVLGPPGYQDAYHYQLATRLAGANGIEVTPWLAKMANDSFANMKRPNVDPGFLTVDTALVPLNGAGYNVYSDTNQMGGR